MTDQQALLDQALMERQPNVRRAFSLVELLVVVAIIGILVALLLPAVQAAREAARRAQCSNNLSQLIMAVQHYESIHRRYPPGTVNATGPVLNQLTGYHHGWIEQILPYLEKVALYQHIDRDVSVYHKNNKLFRAEGISLLTCSSSPQAMRGYSNYAGVHHDVESSIDVDQHGAFFLNSSIRQEDVSDGLGYTIFLGEKIHEKGDLGWMSGTRSILRNMGESLNTARGQFRIVGWGVVSQYPPGASPQKNNNSAYGGNFGAADEQVTAADLGGGTPRGAAGVVGGFASFHPSGANMAMGDGSIRFTINSIESKVYRDLGHRADGALVELE